MLELQRSKLIIADCAEPKSIDEILAFGWFIEPCLKGADSIKHGIDRVLDLKIQVTSRSLNIIKELRNYSWAESKDGKRLQKPIDDFNHAMDAMRYAVMDMLGNDFNLRDAI